MAFRLEDFKKTTRKSGDGSGVPASVYPHQMKDKKAVARLEIAIRTFDALVGKRRRDLDAQTMVDFFGDPRLARGVVACLGQYYQYKTPRFAEIIGTDAANRLTEAGLETPMALRAHTYLHVNAYHDGFLTEAERPVCYGALGETVGLTAHSWDTLLHLDAEENQVLTRPGLAPSAADIVALYNFHALDTCLRRAAKIVLNGLSLTSTEAADVRALAQALGIKAVVAATGATVTLSDPEQSGLLPRRPGRLARCLLYLVHQFATRTTVGYADAHLGTRTFRLALGTDAFKTLGAPLSPKGLALSFRRRTEAGDALYKGLVKLRSQGGAAGWRIKRQPDPVVSAQGILIPDLTLTRAERRVGLVFGGAPGGEWGLPMLSLPTERKPADPATVLAQAEAALMNLFALPAAPPPMVPADVRALCDRAAAQGMVRAAEAQRTLHLLDESPLIEWVRQAQDARVRYIPGVGLCSQELVAAITQDQQTLFPA
jgi:hypothetical protein